MAEVDLTDCGSWIVSQGDTLSSIAKEMGVAVDELTVFHVGSSPRQEGLHEVRPHLIHPGDIVSVRGTTVFLNPLACRPGDSEVAALTRTIMRDPWPGSEGPGSRYAAVWALYEYNDRNLSNVTSPSVRSTVVSALIHALMVDPKSRVGAAATLGNMGEHAAAAVPALIRALRDPNHLVRNAAASALGKIARSPVSAAVREALAAAIPLLTEIITSGRHNFEAARALCGVVEGLGERRHRGLAVLEAIWNWDVNGQVRSEIEGTLRSLGSSLVATN
jgi:hypothetical protein